MRRGWARSARRAAPAALAVAVVAALAFDPWILLISWSAESQEVVAATSRATCETAAAAIRAKRWLAEDRPLSATCRQGNAFPPGSDCIRGFNCPEGR